MSSDGLKWCLVLAVFLSSLVASADTAPTKLSANCTAAEEKAAFDAIDGASQLSTDADNYMVYKLHDKKESYETWFGSVDLSSNVAAVAKAVAAVRSEFDNDSITAECSGTGKACNDGKTLAYVLHGNATNDIHFCKVFFGADKTPADNLNENQQGICIHEMHHFDRLGGAVDCKDDVDGTQDLAKKLAKEKPGVAITCAYNYEWFTTSHPGASCSVVARSFGGAGGTQGGGRSGALCVLFASLLIVIERQRRRLVRTGILSALVFCTALPARAGEPPAAAQKSAKVNSDYAEIRALYHDARIPPTAWKREKPKAYWEATLPADSRFQCNLEAVAASVVAGSPVAIRFKATNLSSSAVRVLKWSTPLHVVLADDSFRIVAPDGKELKYGGPAVRRRRPDDSDYLGIGANQTVTAEMDLYLEGYKMDEPGDYKIDYAGYWSTKPAFPGRSGGSRLVCNPITITVTKAP